jgi:hypothetical protein
MAVKEDVVGIYNPASLASLCGRPDCLQLFARLIDDYTTILSDISRSEADSFLSELQNRVAPHLHID